MIKYSIIMPCFNETHVLQFSLPSIQQAIGERNDVEFLLMDNGSTDNSVVLAEEYNAQAHSLPNLRISALRNRGVQLSQGQYLLFLDADIQVPPNWLATLDRYIEQQTADVLGFVDDVPSSASWYARIWGLRARAKREDFKLVDSLPGRNLFLWTEPGLMKSTVLVKRSRPEKTKTLSCD